MSAATLKTMSTNFDWLPALQQLHTFLEQIENPESYLQGIAATCALLQQNWMLLVAEDDIRAKAKEAMEATASSPSIPPVLAMHARQLLWMIATIETALAQ